MPAGGFPGARRRSIAIRANVPGDQARPCSSQLRGLVRICRRRAKARCCSPVIGGGFGALPPESGEAGDEESCSDSDAGSEVSAGLVPGSGGSPGAVMGSTTGS